MLVNTFSANEKYSLLNRDNLKQPIQMQLLQKQKTFSWVFSSFSKSILNLEQLQKKMALIADVFAKFRTPKYVVK